MDRKHDKPWLYVDDVFSIFVLVIYLFVYYFVPGSARGSPSVTVWPSHPCYTADSVSQTITNKKDGTLTEAAIDFATYGTKSSGDRSGAYLFLPDGPAVVRLPYPHAVLKSEGSSFWRNCDTALMGNETPKFDIKRVDKGQLNYHRTKITKLFFIFLRSKFDPFKLFDVNFSCFWLLLIFKDSTDSEKQLMWVCSSF